MNRVLRILALIGLLGFSLYVLGFVFLWAEVEVALSRIAPGQIDLLMTADWQITVLSTFAAGVLAIVAAVRRRQVTWAGILIGGLVLAALWSIFDEVVTPLFLPVAAQLQVLFPGDPIGIAALFVLEHVILTLPAAFALVYTLAPSLPSIATITGPKGGLPPTPDIDVSVEP